MGFYHLKSKVLEEGTLAKMAHTAPSRRGSRGFEWQDQLSIPITFCCSSWDPAAFKLHVDQGSVEGVGLSSLNTSNYIMPTTKPHIFKQDMYPRIQAHQAQLSVCWSGWERLWHFHAVETLGVCQRFSAICIPGLTPVYQMSSFHGCLVKLSLPLSSAKWQTAVRRRPA